MKRKMSFIAGAMAVCILAGCAFTGCEKKSEEPEKTTETAAVNNYVKKDSDTEVTGEITSIVGNEITLAIGDADTSSSDSDEKPSFEDGERPSFGDGEMPSFEDGEMPSFGDGERPSFGDGEMPSFGDGERPSFGDGERPKRKKSASVTKTGEEKSYIIPAGMPVTGLSGRKTDYSGLSEGMVIKLTVNSDGVVCAAEVL